MPKNLPSVHAVQYTYNLIVRQGGENVKWANSMVESKKQKHQQNILFNFMFVCSSELKPTKAKDDQPLLALRLDLFQMLHRGFSSFAALCGCSR